MKKSWLFVPVLMATLLFVTPAHGASVYFDGKGITSASSPIIVDGRILVPLRMLEQMGDVVVDWQEEGRIAVVITADEDLTHITAIGVPVDKAHAFKMTGTLSEFDAISRSKDNIDWDKVTHLPMSVPAQIVDGRTMVPLRLVAQMLDYDVYWDEVTETVTIYSSTEQ